MSDQAAQELAQPQQQQPQQPQHKKKRGNEIELTKDNFEAQDEETEEGDCVGEFAKADQDALQRRKMVRVRRRVGEPPAPTTSESRPNPFAGVSLTSGGNDGENQSGKKPDGIQIEKPEGRNGQVEVADVGAVKGNTPVAVTVAAAADQEQNEPKAVDGSAAGISQSDATLMDTKVGTDPKRKREEEEGTEDRGTFGEKETEESEEGNELAKKKGKVEDGQGQGLPDPAAPKLSGGKACFSLAFGTGSPPFAAFAASGSPFKGVAESKPTFSSPSIFSVPTLNFGPPKEPIQFGTGANPVESEPSAPSVFNKPPVGGGIFHTAIGNATNPLSGASVTDSCTTQSTIFGSTTKDAHKVAGDKGERIGSTIFSFPSCAKPTPESTNIKPVFSCGEELSAEMMPKEIETVTGEEGEETVFAAEAVLYQMNTNWHQKGRGELKLNVRKSGPARLIMRQKATLKVFLNANLYPQMVPKAMDRANGVVIRCVNWLESDVQKSSKDEDVSGTSNDETDDSKNEMNVFAIKFLDKGNAGAAVADACIRVINEYKVRGVEADSNA